MVGEAGTGAEHLRSFRAEGYDQPTRRAGLPRAG
jgi:hypothetical protein